LSESELWDVEEELIRKAHGPFNLDEITDRDLIGTMKSLGERFHLTE